jgi:hypothetical protein
MTKEVEGDGQKENKRTTRRLERAETIIELGRISPHLSSDNASMWLRRLRNYF